jgi:hypothetical protein
MKESFRRGKDQNKKHTCDYDVALSLEKIAERGWKSCGGVRWWTQRRQKGTTGGKNDMGGRGMMRTGHVDHRAALRGRATVAMEPIRKGGRERTKVLLETKDAKRVLRVR